jgi:transposase
VLRGKDMQEFMEMKRGGLSTQAISELTGCDRKTVRKYLRKPEAVPRYGPRAHAP